MKESSEYFNSERDRDCHPRLVSAIGFASPTATVFEFLATHARAKIISFWFVAHRMHDQGLFLFKADNAIRIRTCQVDFLAVLLKALSLQVIDLILNFHNSLYLFRSGR